VDEVHPLLELMSDTIVSGVLVISHGQLMN
jgi:hypothetical protein